MVFVFEVCFVSARGPPGVRFGFTLRPVGVCSGSALADPDWTPKANPRSDLSPLSVRLGPVGTVHVYKHSHTSNIYA